MTEPAQCLDHLETEEGDFFCDLGRGHEGEHSFSQEVEQSIAGLLGLEGEPLFLRRFRVTWGR